MIHPAETTAAILAGGLGTRLRSVVADRPKVLAHIGQRPFIEYLLDQLADGGISVVVLCVGYKGDMVKEHLGNSYRGMRLFYSLESEPRGTGGALRLALPLLTAPTTLVMNGDSYCDAGLDGFLQWHHNRHSRATLMLAKTDDTRRYGRVDTDDRNRIVNFQEKAATTGAGWVNAGLYLLQQELIGDIPPDRSVSLEREMFPRWIPDGLHGYRSEGRLWDIGVPDAYAEAQSDFVNAIAKNRRA